MYSSYRVCEFVKSYAEGSSLLGIESRDLVLMGNTSSGITKKIKASFGCTIKETGLFKTQFADGILGMDDKSEFILSS